ncbi:MAG: STAS/SEC14 domain-containing protein [Bacteroidia bacterium]
MIYQILDLPPNMIGFKAAWKVTKKDFDEVVIPCVEKHVEKMGQINYLLILGNSVKNLNFLTWLKDTLLSLKYITKWNRAAIVSSSTLIIVLTKIFSLLLPGEFRVFSRDNIDIAINWVATGNLS